MELKLRLKMPDTQEVEIQFQGTFQNINTILKLLVDKFGETAIE